MTILMMGLLVLCVVQSVLLLISHKSQRDLIAHYESVEEEKMDGSKDEAFFNYAVSPSLSIGDENVKGLSSLMQRLDDAWDPVYMNHVRDRVLNKGNISEKNYPYYEQELKRYFILTSLYQNVPMYNTNVDEIWHEMMMFTRSYEKFCQAFVGKMIHHEPNMTPGAPNLDEKPFFTWVYRFLFGITNDTSNIYPFIADQDLSSSLLKNIEQLSESMLVDRYFAPVTPDALLVAKHVVKDTKKRFEDIHETARFHKRAPSLVKANYRKTGTESKDSFLFENMLEADLFDFDTDRDVASSLNSWSTSNGSRSSKFDDHSSTNTYTDTSSHSSKHSCSSSSCSSKSSCSSSSCSSSSCSSSSCSSSSCSS